jgi:alkane 1-monooxygenase
MISGDSAIFAGVKNRMHIRSLKYITPLVVFALAILSFTQTGWVTFLPLLYAFGIIPFLEWWLRPDASNLDAASEELIRSDRLYDYILYLFVFLQIAAVVYFLDTIGDMRNDLLSMSGRIATMGLLCGIFGINIGHELGHRGNIWERRLAKISLMTSLYMHFYIEHNKGHHKHVATYNDPGSARKGESIYSFWPRAIVNCYRNAWKISGKEMCQRGKPILHFSNEMLQMQLKQALFVGVIAWRFGSLVLFCFLASALIGILLLETVNYIEHYGLQRKSLGEGKYERPLPIHSWNSNHIMGRLMLFELSRHSDHHYQASRKYQLLRHHAEAPQMPTGYPGMMLLSLIPPLWFNVMHKKIKSL